MARRAGRPRRVRDGALLARGALRARGFSGQCVVARGAEELGVGVDAGAGVALGALNARVAAALAVVARGALRHAAGGCAGALVPGAQKIENSCHLAL